MSDITPTISLRLEVLPDEILLEIFQYMKPIDLLSFKGHNQRINKVIRDVKLNIVIQYPEQGEEEDFDNLLNFLPIQVIRLELRYGWSTLNLNVFQHLCSLTLDCSYLSKEQLDQVFSMKLPHLERLSIVDVPHPFRKELLLTVPDSDHFPSLKICQFTGEFYSGIDINDHCQLPNNTIRTLILSKWYGSQLGSLFNLLPNLRRFETTFDESIHSPLNLDMPHMSLVDLQLTLDDPSNDLNELLQHMPNLKRLYVRGKIGENSVLEHFKKLSKSIHTHTAALQHFACELYFHSWDRQVDILVIQQLHPLFKTIQCHLGKSIHQCYATDLTEYPFYSEYSYVERPENRTTMYSQISSDYDRYDDDYDDDNGWFNNGLSYRENYKRAYMCSPWSGNNDD